MASKLEVALKKKLSRLADDTKLAHTGILKLKQLIESESCNLDLSVLSQTTDEFDVTVEDLLKDITDLVNKAEAGPSEEQFSTSKPSYIVHLEKQKQFEERLKKMAKDLEDSKSVEIKFDRVLFHLEGDIEVLKKNQSDIDDQLKTALQTMSSPSTGSVDLSSVNSKLAEIQTKSTESAKKLQGLQKESEDMKCSITSVNKNVQIHEQEVARLKGKMTEFTPLLNQTKNLVKLEKVLNKLHLEKQFKIDMKREMEKISKQVDTKGTANQETVFFQADVKSYRRPQVGSCLDKTIRHSFSEHYNNISSQFVTPKVGLYYISLSLSQASTESGSLSLYVRSDNGNQADGCEVRTNGPDEKCSASTIMRLNKGEKIGVGVRNVDGAAQIASCIFSGFWLGKQNCL